MEEEEEEEKGEKEEVVVEVERVAPTGSTSSIAIDELTSTTPIPSYTVKLNVRGDGGGGDGGGGKSEGAG